jgi:hypothetical protein
MCKLKLIRTMYMVGMPKKMSTMMRAGSISSQVANLSRSLLRRRVSE